ncbi:hypothetical protein BX616_002702 [Lobosporangium transversale]|uniref:BTB domain-containing protein n=1 Tax=Lobosporangium transversale TaxID=64571 RepID=A0A1Y2GN04_9FUNG|nr:hypothetical protein BCR41DRAFT_396568 [Lobosporangium transversale]KAF9919038.1 hypothetical protein BX616_002702 [Lobosporangium transversale]ORZ14830.1 hypothetical protein BCR41DRAFT_396568 [Lobosporangium transversale]|eukprot:XP_021880962.1 hypothetical protein BCR41DRAFT_396568 [Lobosporangium transversale]
MEPISEQNYVSTLTFSVVCSQFESSSLAVRPLPVQTIVRTFDKASTNLSLNGRWHCVFEETKRHYQNTTQLSLSLKWIPIKYLGGISEEGTYSTDNDNIMTLNPACELIRRIRSIKVRSDSTLSELLFAQMDGDCILNGEFIKVRLQPNRVLRNDRYKFRISFYTQDISYARFLGRPIFFTFMDIDTFFDPVQYLPNDLPDIFFQFPAYESHEEIITIQAHSSMICRSQYFAQRLAEVAGNSWRGSTAFRVINCMITEFRPPVFRVMLRFIYTGRLLIEKHSRRNKQIVSSLHSTISTQQAQGPVAIGKVKTNEGHQQKGRQSDVVYFEDLYRISERYEIPELRALSLKAIQCTLNMSIAIAMIAKQSSDPRKADVSKDDGNYVHYQQQKSTEDEAEEMKPAVRQEYYMKIQKELVKNMVKEYIQFFATEASRLTIKDMTSTPVLSAQEGLQMVRVVGDLVLENAYRLWE